MAHETKWLVGALAAALWIAPAAAAGNRTAGERVDDTAAATKQGAHDAADKAGETADKAGEKVSGAATDAKESASSAAAKTGDKAKEVSEKLSTSASHSLTKLHEGNEMEVQAGGWMKEHARSSDVKKFAEKMVDDHAKLDEDVRSFAKDHGVDLPMHPTMGEHAAKLKHLQAATGASADREYMRMMVAAHEKDVKEVRAAKAKAQQEGNDALAKLLDGAASKMQGHLEDAREVQKSLQQRQARTPESRDQGTGSSSTDSSSK
jgi:putative membrane protein